MNMFQTFRLTLVMSTHASSLEKTWVFRLNVASCESFLLLKTTDEKEANVQRYYMTITTLLTNNVIDNELTKCKTVKEFDEYAVEALLPENNQKYVIITKDHKFDIKNATYHKEEVAVTCKPTSRETLNDYFLTNESKIVKCSTIHKI